MQRVVAAIGDAATDLRTVLDHHQRNGSVMRSKQAMAMAAPVKPPPATHSVKGAFRIVISALRPVPPTTLIHRLSGGNEALLAPRMGAEVAGFASAMRVSMKRSARGFGGEAMTVTGKN